MSNLPRGRFFIFKGKHCAYKRDDGHSGPSPLQDSDDKFLHSDETSEETTPSKRMLAWAKNSAIYRLERQMLSEQQLSKAIAKKAKEKFDAISAEQIEALARYAVEFGYSIKAINDENFADITTRNSIRAGKSRRQIAEKLKTKGIEKTLITSAIEEVDDLHSALIYARKRRFGPFRREEPDEKRKAKEMSAFARSGYSFELARRIYKMELEEAEELMFSAPAI